MNRKLSEIKYRKRFRQDVGDIAPLVESIKQIGLLHPVVIRENGTLVAGLRRLTAFAQLGKDTIPVTVVDIDDIRKAEVDENTIRKDFTIEEMVAIRRAFEPDLQKEAEKRKKEGQESGGRGHKKLGANFAPSLEGSKTRDQIASYVGVSGRHLDKVTAIVEMAEKQPDKFKPVVEKIDRGKLSVDHAYQMVQRENNKGSTPPLPEGAFSVIYADPPWQYDLPLRGAPDSHYATMTQQEIELLEVPSADDAVLFLWATAPKLREALGVMKAWGFEYKTNAVWVKQKFGTGYYFRGQHEHLLLGIKGTPHPPAEGDRRSSVITADSGEHSAKPVAVYGIIEAMYPGGKYLEMFARGTKRKKWTVWGQE